LTAVLHRPPEGWPEVVVAIHTTAGVSVPVIVTGHDLGRRRTLRISTVHLIGERERSLQRAQIRHQTGRSANLPFDRAVPLSVLSASPRSDAESAVSKQAEGRRRNVDPGSTALTSLVDTVWVSVRSVSVEGKSPGGRVVCSVSARARWTCRRELDQLRPGFNDRQIVVPVIVIRWNDWNVNSLAGPEIIVDPRDIGQRQLLSLGRKSNSMVGAFRRSRVAVPVFWALESWAHGQAALRPACYRVPFACRSSGW